MAVEDVNSSCFGGVAGFSTIKDAEGESARIGDWPGDNCQEGSKGSGESPSALDILDSSLINGSRSVVMELQAGVGEVAEALVTQWVLSCGEANLGLEQGRRRPLICSTSSLV